MARIRHVSVKNFRCIKDFSWYPNPGINCLIGPGDSGKSSILDAIDLCLGARRTIQFTDADFHGLCVDEPIEITITVGELSDALKSLDAYGAFLRGFDQMLGMIEDEPSADSETVLSLKLTVGSDLDPVWTLVSERAAAQNLTRYLTWGDRLKLAPTRIGASPEYHLAWRRGSVLNRLSEEKADASAALASAARHARAAFGDLADEQLGAALGIVAATAKDLGIPVGDPLKAMLDAHAVSFGGGAIAIHGEDGVPLRALGVGSARLLVAGLQRKAAEDFSIILVDELEFGLEPHRIIRFLHSLGAKEQQAPLQAFVTSHSPAVLRELAASQLTVIRASEGSHAPIRVPSTDEVQGTLRKYPEAFLAPSVLVCEGASEVGFLRGLDQYWSSHGKVSLMALGVALVDAGGVSELYTRANAFKALGYRTAALRDDDKQPDEQVEQAFIASGCKVFKWRPGRALEDELFMSLPETAVSALLQAAIDLHGEDVIKAHIQSASNGAISLADCEYELSETNRAVLGRASRTKKGGWFKTVGWMEDVARDVVAPAYQQTEQGFKDVMNSVGQWIAGG